MVKTKRIISVIICSIWTLMMLFCNVSCIGVETYLEGKTYNSVEELHEDLVTTMKIEANIDDADTFVRELIYYFQIEDIIAVLSTQSMDADSEIIQNELYVYFVRETNNKYELLTPIYGWGQWAEIKLGYEYTLGGNYHYYANVKINNKEQSICFLYKDINETKSVYFDGKKTNEIEMTNPFDGTQFFLCYGISEVASFWHIINNPWSIEKMHTIELR